MIRLVGVQIPDCKTRNDFGSAGYHAARDRLLESRSDRERGRAGRETSGGRGGAAVTYDNGKEVTFSNKADIPELFPSDVPLPEGMQVVSSIGSDRGVTVMFDTELSYDDVVELYVDYAQKAGYTELHRLEEENSIHYSSQRGTEIFAFHLQLSMEDNKTIEGAIDYRITDEPAQEEVEE